MDKKATHHRMGELTKPPVFSINKFRAITTFAPSPSDMTKAQSSCVFDSKDESSIVAEGVVPGVATIT